MQPLKRTAWEWWENCNGDTTKATSKGQSSLTSPTRNTSRLQPLKRTASVKTNGIQMVGKEQPEVLLSRKNGAATPPPRYYVPIPPTHTHTLSQPHSTAPLLHSPPHSLPRPRCLTPAPPAASASPHSPVPTNPNHSLPHHTPVASVSTPAALASPPHSAASAPAHSPAPTNPNLSLLTCGVPRPADRGGEVGRWVDYYMIIYDTIRDYYMGYMGLMGRWREVGGVLARSRHGCCEWISLESQ